MKKLIESYGNMPNSHLYAGVFLLLAVISLSLFISSPITGGDNDLWYHLNGGRFILETGSVPGDSSHISFIEPARKWTDYYWLFQVMAYKVFTVSGYTGLILMRTLIYGLVIALAFRLFLKMRQERGDFLFQTVVLVLLAAFVVQRFQLVRPHAFSYLFIVLFIVSLELRSRLRYFLPVFAVLWVNIHGIAYPVMVLICIAYISETFLDNALKRRPLDRAQLKSEVLPLLLCMLAIFASPHGYGLIKVPFHPFSLSSQYINELKSFFLPEWFGFSVYLDTGIRSYLSLFNAFLIIVVYAFIKSLYSRRLRLSHVVLLAGGAYLLTKGVRFVHEFAFLSLPFLAHYAQGNPGERTTVSIRSILAALLIILLPLSFFLNVFPYKEKYPFSFEKLPRGVSAFLSHVKASGNVLNEAYNGGFLQWETGRDYRIFMDMEVPFLFTDEDFFMSTGAYHSPEIFRKLNGEYRLSFVSVPLDTPEFIQMIEEFPEYSLVFFDDEEYLYVNSRLLPEIASEYSLEHVTPYNIGIDSLMGLESGDRQAFLEEIESMHDIYPDGLSVNQALGTLHMLSGDLDSAALYADVLTSLYPNRASGYYILGEALLQGGDYRGAEAAFQKALARSYGNAVAVINRKLFRCYLYQDEPGKAYPSLKRAAGSLFTHEASYEDMYLLGVLAMSEGRADDALYYLRFAWLETPLSDTRIRAKIREALGRFEELPEEWNSY